MPAVLFPSDPLRPRRPDPHWAAQAAAVRDAGGAVALVDHDAVQRGDAAAAVRAVPERLGAAWYRGWMVSAAGYAALAAALAGRGVRLLTTPAAYRRAHELPGWYPAFAAVTPASVWADGPGADPVALAARLGGGPGIVKDFVKSRKHEWDEACFVPDLADAAALRRVVGTFVTRQGDDLAGGVVLRRFEPLERGEARVWWLDGAPVLVGPHPDTPGTRAEPDLSVVPRDALDRFAVTDLARRADGVWRVVEVGDGQVSDLPSTVDPAALTGPLLAAPD